MLSWRWGLVFALLPLVACNKKEGAPPKQVAAQAVSAGAFSAEDPPPPSISVALPASIGRDTGDLDAMVRRRNIRVLVLLTPISFFYDKGHPRGIVYEALEELQSFLNKKLKTGTLDVKVTFIPTSPAQVEAALTEGLGDIIAYGIVVTPEREKRVAFSSPIQTDVTQIIVTGSGFGPVSTIEELGGKEVYANPLSTYYDNLQKVNASLQKGGKTPIVIKAADKNLMDDDLVQMVNAGLIPATVTTKQRADLWSNVLVNVKPHPELVIAGGEQLAWVMRKNNPQLKQAVDDFVKSHAAGTSFGNTLLRRYLRDTEWVRNSTSGRGDEEV